MRWKNIISFILIVLLITSLIPFSSMNSRAQGPYSGNVKAMDSQGEGKYYFRNEDQLFFEVNINDNGSKESEFITITVEKLKNRTKIEEIRIRTKDNGTYYSWEENTYFDLSGYELGSYILNISAPTPGDYQTSTFEIYEPNYKKGSSIYTTDKYFSKKDHYFQKDSYGEVLICYKIELLDQHGNPMTSPHRPTVKVDVRNDETLETYEVRVNTDGINKESFILTHPKTEDYRLILYDDNTKIEYARSDSFVITDIKFDSPKKPDESIYTQGENITLDITGELTERVDISIMNRSHGNVIGSWDNVQFENGSWSTEYKIPNGILDGIYHVIIKNNETKEHILGVDSKENKFKIKKYELDIYTAKAAYIAGEEVNVLCMSTNILNGSEVEDVSIEWKASLYYSKENMEIKNGTTGESKFSFSIPENLTEGFIKLDVWANDTKGNTDNKSKNIIIGGLRGTLQLDKYEYLKGETIFAEIKSYVDYPSTWDEQSPIEDANIQVRLIDPSGNRLENYTTEAVTGDEGDTIVPITLDENIKTGTYSLEVNITKNKQKKIYSQGLEVKDPEERIKIITESISEQNPYHPGEIVNLSFVVKQNLKEVKDANVKYRLYSENKIYEYSYVDTDDIEFKIPDEFNPSKELKLYIGAQKGQDVKAEKIIEIPVSAGYILLNADQTYYKPGDIVGFTYEYNDMNEVKNVNYKIIEGESSYSFDEDDLVKYGQLDSNEFSFTIPENPSNFYQVKVELVTSSGNKISDDIEIERWKGYDLDLKLVSESDYTNDIFKPGDKLKFKYKLIPKGDSSIPDTVVITYGFPNLGVQKRIETTEKQGTLKLKLPERGDGDYIFSASSTSSGGYSSYDYDSKIINVDEDPSWMDKKAVFGISMFNLLILLISLIALVLAVISSFKGKDIGLSKMKKKTKKKILKKKKTEDEGEEGKSAAEKAHEWSGPVKKETEEPSEPSEKDESQIEPEEPRW